MPSCPLQIQSDHGSSEKPIEKKSQFRFYTAQHSRAHVSSSEFLSSLNQASYPQKAPINNSSLKRWSLTICAFITVISVIAIALLSRWSSVRHTHSTTGSLVQRPIPLLSPPHAWQIIWQSPTTGAAVVDDNVVITQNAHTVQGRDPFDGDLLWQYQRAEPLCQAIEFEDYILANFRDRRGCGDVTALLADNGSRYASRSSFSDPDAYMTNTGDYILSLGSSRAELWDDSLHELIEYGELFAPVYPGTQPRQGCRLISGLASHDRVAIVEKCPHEEFDRLTILKSQPKKDSNDPEQVQSRALPILGTGTQSKVLCVSDTKTLIAVSRNPSHTDLISVQKNDEGTLTSFISTEKFAHPLGPTISSSSIEYSYWMNGQTIIFDRSSFAVKQIIPHTLGPGVDVNDTWYIPVSEGELMVNNNHTKLYPFLRKYPPLHSLDKSLDDLDDSYVSSDTDGSHIFEVSHGILTALKPV